MARIDEVKKKLEKLLLERSPAKKTTETLYRELEKIKAILEHARASGFSFNDLSKLLIESGIEAKPHQVARFFGDVLKAPKRRRRRSKKSRSTPAKSPNPASPPKASATHATPGLKKSFRVAKEDL